MELQSLSRQDGSPGGAPRRGLVAAAVALLLIGAASAPAGAAPALTPGTEAVDAATVNATDDAVEVESAVEYDGVVEVVFSGNVTRESVRDATVTVDGHEVDAVSEGRGPHWWFTLDSDVRAGSTVRIDFGDVEAVDGGVASDVSTEARTTTALVDERGDATTPDEAATVLQGETIGVVADGVDREIAIEDEDGDVRIVTATEGQAIAYDTSKLEAGERYRVAFGGNRTQHFRLAAPTMNVTAEPSVVEPNETVTVSVSEALGDGPLSIEIRGDGTTIQAGTRLDDGRATYEFRPQSPGNYTATVTDQRTGVTAATEPITVESTSDDGENHTGESGDVPAVESAAESNGVVDVGFSENVTEESVSDATVSVDGREADAATRGDGSNWWFVLDRDVPENASVRVDFGSVVAEDGATARNVTTEVETSSASIHEYGNATSPETAVSVTRGETIAFASGYPDTSVAVRGDGVAIQTSTSAHTFLYDTKALDPGVYEVTFGENRTQYFEVEPLNLTATAEPSVVEPNETVTITARADRGDAPVDVEIHSDDTFVVTQLELASDGQVTYEYRPQEPGNYTVTVTDVRTGIAAGASVAVRQAEPPASPVANATPTDPDGDGLYEDLNGNGETDYADVVAYFGSVGEPPLADHVDAYDYNGNGEIDYADLVDLFEQV